MPGPIPRPPSLLALALTVAFTPHCRRFHHPRRTAPVHHGHPARVHRAATAADLLRGPNTAARLGDWVIENDFVRAIVDDVHQGGGFALSGGQLIDLAPRDGEDEIGQVFNFLGRFPRQLRYRSMDSTVLADGTAVITVHGDDPRTPGLDGETLYSLGRDDRAITLSTTLVNHGSAPTEVGLGDAIQWSGAEHWAPHFGFALPRTSDEPFLAGVGARASYAYVAPHPLHGPNGGNWSNPTQGTTTLVPGASITYTRRIGVAPGGDVASALASTGWYRAERAVRVHADATDVPGALEGVRVLLRDEQGAPAMMSSTDAHGNALLPVAPGIYHAEVTAAGRAPDDVTTQLLTRPIDARRANPPTLGLVLGAESTLAVRVFEHRNERDVPAPGRVLIFGVDGTPDPYLGAIGRASGARNSFVVSHRAPGIVPLAPGHYRIVATRGPMRTLAETTVTIAPGEQANVSLTVARAIDLNGYLCGDFHTHQAPSLDSPVALRDRVRAAAGEGLDVIAATDHNVATDLGPAIRDEDLTAELLTLGGDEVSTDVAVHPTGHWNLYPLEVRSDAPLGGAPDLFELDPIALVRRAREIAPDAVIQVNHPRSGSPTGLFDVVGFDRATATATRGVLAPTFDAIEVWNGRYQPQAEAVMLDWLALLRTGARITATANSDSHAIVLQEVGYPRTCFAAPGNDVAWITPRDVVHAIREVRDAVLTDGPMIRVLAPDGASAIGRTLSLAPGGITLTVHIESADWVPVTMLELIHSDGRIEPIPVQWHPRDHAIVGDVRLQATARDAFVLFRVRGTEPNPVLTGDPPLLPMALTNPVYLR